MQDICLKLREYIEHKMRSWLMDFVCVTPYLHFDMIEDARGNLSCEDEKGFITQN